MKHSPNTNFVEGIEALTVDQMLCLGWLEINGLKSIASLFGSFVLQAAEFDPLPFNSGPLTFEIEDLKYYTATLWIDVWIILSSLQAGKFSPESSKSCSLQ